VGKAISMEANSDLLNQHVRRIITLFQEIKITTIYESPLALYLSISGSPVKKSGPPLEIFLKAV